MIYYSPRMPKPASTAPSAADEKLDQVLYYLQRMDRRDKWRTIGGFFRTLISFIPVVVLLWSVWYVVEHGSELMTMIIKQTASATAEATKGSGQGMLDELMKQYALPRK